MCKYTKGSLFVHKIFIFNCYSDNSSKEQCYDVVMFFITHKFFHNNCPGKPLPGHSSFYGSFCPENTDNRGFFIFIPFPWKGNLIFDTCEERKVPQPLENTGLWHFSPWNRYMVMFYLRLLFFSISFIFRFVIN